MRHFAAADIAQRREELPGHWWIEVDLGTCAALIQVDFSSLAASGRSISSIL